MMIGGAVAVVVLGGAYMLLSPSRAPKPVQLTSTEPPPPPSAWVEKTAEVANTSYGFYFKYPKDWGPGFQFSGNVVQSVGRRDGVYCSVSIVEKRHESDETGKPKTLAALLTAATDKNVSGLYGSAKAKVDKFAPGKLGKQDSREFMMTVTGGTVGDIKVHGHLTMRDQGVVYLICAAPTKIYPGKDVQDPFKLVMETFEFDGRPR